MFAFRWFASLATLAITGSLAFPHRAFAETPAMQPVETKEQKDARMAWWREAKFGLFIHWGLYAVPAGTYDGKQIPGIGEWIMNDAEIPMDVYQKYAEQFNPTKFDADEWVSLAKAAGMKYIVITSKHHDGFAMFHSAASKFNIVDATPFNRDVIKELSLAAAKQGIKFGVYYSQSQDWNHPGGDAVHREANPHRGWDPGQAGSFDEYLKTVAEPQVRELLTDYGPISILWWDTPQKITPAQAGRLHELLKLQPNIITNNRLGGGFKGDSETPEQEIPANGFPDGRNWETCMTINDTWGYKSYDRNFKSTETLVRNLVDIASKGGNYLLNVGPDATGVIPAGEADRLKEVGKWMKVNGESIYGTTASPFPKQPSWGRITQKNEKLFLHVFDWPKERSVRLPGGRQLVKAYLLSDPAKLLKYTSEREETIVGIPAAAPDPIDSVIVLELAAPAIAPK